VRVVQQQPCVVPLAEVHEPWHVRDVAIHAEHGVGGDQPHRRGGSREARLQRIEVRVRVARAARAREQRAVVEARVVEAVGEHFGVAIAQRRHDPQVGRIAAAEEKRARKPHEAGETPLGVVVDALVAAHERRGARAGAPGVDRRVRGLPQRRVVGETEVVVAGEVEDGAAVDHDARALGAVQHAALAAKPGAVERGQALGERRRRAAHDAHLQAGFRPSAARSASSRCTSGLPVVRSFSP
jgi:hypothetical protein